MDTTTLFAANMIILWVMGAALMVAGWNRRHEPYWESWIVANLILGVAEAMAMVERIRLTISGGVCHSADAPGDFDALVRLADAGLYEAKNGGRNRIEKIAA